MRKGRGERKQFFYNALLFSIFLISVISHAEELVSYVIPAGGALHSGPILSLSIGESVAAPGAGPLAGIGWSYTLGPLNPKTLVETALEGLGVLSAVHAIEIKGQSMVQGHIEAHASLRLAGQGFIDGNALSPIITLQGQARISGESIISSNTIAFPLIHTGLILENLSRFNDNALIPSGFLDASQVLRVKSGQSLALSTGVYHVSGLELLENSRLTIQGEVRLIVHDATGSASGAGHIEVKEKAGWDIAHGASLLVFSQTPAAFKAHSSLNQNGNPKNLILIVAGSSVSLWGQGSALIYAPNCLVELKDSALWRGRILAKEISLTGQSQILDPQSQLQALALPQNCRAPLNIRTVKIDIGG